MPVALGTIEPEVSASRMRSGVSSASIFRSGARSSAAPAPWHSAQRDSNSGITCSTCAEAWAGASANRTADRMTINGVFTGAIIFPYTVPHGMAWMRCCRFLGAGSCRVPSRRQRSVAATATGARASRGRESAGDWAVRRGHASARHPLARARQHQRHPGARARGGLRDAQPACGVVGSRLPRARLQLAQGDAAARGRGLSRVRARPARLRPHRRHRGHVRRRPVAVPDVQPRHRHGGVGVGVGLSHDGRRRRSRRRLRHRRLVRRCAARHLPIGRDDERAVRRSAGAAVRHR